MCTMFSLITDANVIIIEFVSKCSGYITVAKRGPLRQPHPDSNHHLLHTHKTSYLLHFNHYDSMQENHIEATLLTNRYITLLNSQLNMHTPRLAQDILYKPSSRRPTHRFRHHVLPDGIHPDKTIKQKWAKTLLETISTNRYKHQ